METGIYGNYCAFATKRCICFAFPLVSIHFIIISVALALYVLHVYVENRIDIPNAWKRRYNLSWAHCRWAKQEARRKGERRTELKLRSNARIVDTKSYETLCATYCYHYADCRDRNISPILSHNFPYARHFSMGTEHEDTYRNRTQRAHTHSFILIEHKESKVDPEN